MNTNIREGDKSAARAAAYKAKALRALANDRYDTAASYLMLASANAARAAALKAVATIDRRYHAVVRKGTTA